MLSLIKIKLTLYEIGKSKTIRKNSINPSYTYTINIVYCFLVKYTKYDNMYKKYQNIIPNMPYSAIILTYRL